MNTIFFLLDIKLENPRRGTPLHICTMLERLRKTHRLIVCTRSVPESLRDIFVPYPKLRGFRKLRALRNIVAEHRITHVFTASETGLLAPVLLKYLCQVKIVEEIHGVNYEEYRADGSIGLIHYYTLKCRAWFLFRFYDTVIVMSKKAADYYLPISRNWIVAYPSIVPSEIPDTRTRYDSPELIIGYMGNARAYQGLKYLIEAAAITRRDGIPLRLNLVISGDDEPLRLLINSFRLSDITKISHNVPHEAAYRMIGSSSVLVIPRPSIPVTEYAFPSKLSESLATGIPVVVTDVGPVGELREELDRCSIIIGHEHIAEELAGALKKLHAMSKTERSELGTRARAYAFKKFNWDTREKLISDQFKA